MLFHHWHLMVTNVVREKMHTVALRKLNRARLYLKITFCGLILNLATDHNAGRSCRFEFLNICSSPTLDARHLKDLRPDYEHRSHRYL